MLKALDKTLNPIWDSTEIRFTAAVISAVLVAPAAIVLCDHEQLTIEGLQH